MSDVTVTLHGYVGQDVTLKQMGRYDMATFRVGTTPRWRDQQGTYRNGETVWSSVTCWRTLAQNVKESVHVGDPVVVIGKVRTERWTTPEGQQRERQYVEATTVAHDLQRGTSIFRKTVREDRSSQGREPLGAVLEAAEQAPVDIDPVTGEPLYPMGTASRAGEHQDRSEPSEPSEPSELSEQSEQSEQSAGSGPSAREDDEAA